MQVLKQHKLIILVAVFLAAILLASFFIVENASKPTQTSTPSPPPTQTPTPKGTASPSNMPTLKSQTPSPSPSLTPTATAVPQLFPGEATQYQGQNLTSVSTFIGDLIQHPDVSIGGVQSIVQADYHLTVSDLVNQPLSYTYNDVVNNFTAYQKVATLTCVEGWIVTMLWQGVRVTDLLQKAGVSANATTLIFSASDGYTTALPLDYVVQNNLILAYKINNVTLTARTGWPFMLVAQNQYGYKWIMWVTGIDVSNDSSYLGYWESQGYPNNATVISG